MGGTSITHGKVRNSYNTLAIKPETKRPLGRRRRRWEEGLKIGLRETGWDDVGRIHLAQGRDQRRAPVNTVIKFRVT
jgi:hypothetical protein